MPIQEIRGLGTKGVIMDTAAVLLDPSSFTNARNVRFDDGSVKKITGEVQILPDLSSNPVFGIHWPRPDTRYNIYADSNGRVFRINQAGNVSQISGATLPSSDARWQGSLFTGGYAVVINNTVQTPQYVLYTGAGGAEETSLTDLPGWNYEGNVSSLTAQVVRPLQNVLIAGNLRRTISGVVHRQPGTIRISNRAAPGSVPQSWDVNLPTADTAAAFELSQTEDIIEMLPLRGSMFVYTGNSYHSVTPNPIITQETSVINYYGYGILASDCVQEFDGQHFVVDRNDIYVHSGTGTIQSVADGRVRRYFKQHLNPTHYENTFVSLNRREDEIWVCFPNRNANAAGDCNEALIWNYRENHWTIRDLPNARSGFNAPMIRSNTFDVADERLILVSRPDNRFYATDEGSTFNGTNFLSFVESKRRAATSEGSSKWVGSFYPIFNANETTSTAITISLRGQNNFADDIDFSDRKTDVRVFNPSTSYKIDPRTNGRLINYRVESNDANTWTFSGIGVDIELDDQR